MGTDTPPLRRILVVDDSSVARNIVVRCLRGLGYDEVEFDDSAQVYQVQVSVPVFDGDTVIGAITFGVDVDAVEQSGV